MEIKIMSTTSRRKSNVRTVMMKFAALIRKRRAVAPIVDQLSTEYSGKVKFTKLNTDDSPMTPGKLGIMGIPTLIVFKAGSEVMRLVGARPKGDIKRALDASLA